MYGQIIFVFVLFFLTAIGGAICFTIFSSAIGPMVGASGAVFGFIGIWQYWEFTFRKKRGLTLKPFFSTLLGLILVNFVIFLMLEGGLAWQAHLGGFLVGFGVGPFFSIKNNWIFFHFNFGKVDIFFDKIRT